MSENLVKSNSENYSNSAWRMYYRFENQRVYSLNKIITQNQIWPVKSAFISDCFKTVIFDEILIEVYSVYYMKTNTFFFQSLHTWAPENQGCWCNLHAQTDRFKV